MPHFIVEYSANLDSQLSIPKLCEAIHQAAIETGIFPLKGARTRAVEREHYVIADGHPDNAFIHIQGLIGAGRDDATKKSAASHIFDALCEFTAPYFARMPLALSIDFQEIDEATGFKLNNLPQWLAQRAAEKDA